MTSILKDNKGGIYHIQTCKYCTDYKGRPKPILPEDMRDAKKMPDGSYKCLTCHTEEIQDMIVRVTPNSDGAKEIIAERKEAERKELEFKRWEAQVRKCMGERLGKNG
jgi:hypothetical protein